MSILLSMDDLTSDFLRDGIAQDELIEFLSWGWDSTTTENGNYLYGCCIDVQCNKRHEIVKIVGQRSSPLVSQKLRQFEEAFSDNGLTVGMRTAYSRLPIRGFYRYGDILQIYPVPNPPEHTLINVPHPFIIQFSYKDSSCSGVCFHRQNKKAFEIIHLLSSLIKYGITLPSNDQTFCKIMDDDDEPFAKEKMNHYVELSYSPDSDASNQIEKDELGFYLPENLLPIHKIMPNDYYGSYGVMPREFLGLPESIDLLLKNYFNLEDTKKEIYIRAAYWLTKSSEFFSLSKSAAYVCLVQAIEALIGSRSPAYKECDKEGCSAKIKSSVGPTAAFKEFIGQYAQEIDNAVKDEFYSIRSSISHGSKILDSDMGIHSFGQKSTDEREKHELLRRVVVVCLINWLGVNSSANT